MVGAEYSGPLGLSNDRCVMNARRCDQLSPPQKTTVLIINFALAEKANRSLAENSE